MLWARAFATPAEEFPLTPLSVISGKVPPGLRGSLYRNGAGRLERGGISVGHWFDGDGAILAVHFTDAGVNATYRYVQTAGYQEENQAGKYLYGNYGMTAPGAIWNQWRKPVKNSANTSVLALPDKLLALWEGDNPHSLDLQTLETFGLDNLGGLTPGIPYSAHPKIDGETGEIFNFGISLGKNATLNLFKSDVTGKIIKTGKITLEGFPVVHDFVLAGRYLIFFMPPVQINVLPIMLGIRSYSDCMQWQPQLGTKIYVFDRETFDLVSQGETEPWFQWHFANGYLGEQGTAIIDFARYQDFQTNQYLKEVATGVTQTLAETTYTRISLNPQTAKVEQIENIINRTCEFPIVPPQNVGKYSHHTYFSIARQGTDISQEILNAIATFDHHTQTLTEANFITGEYPSEPIYVQDRENPETAWILTVVYDGNHHSSQVWIYDAARLDVEPTCKLQLPQVIPHSFHGTWKQN